MREIKFRAFQDNEMLTSPISSNYGLSRFFGMLYEDAKIMEFSGMKDRKGVDIFEGDIVAFEDSEIFQIEFGSGTFGAMGHFGFYSLIDWNWMELEVIGNIYENPGLI
jgi:hypothetical protein